MKPLPFFGLTLLLTVCTRSLSAAELPFEVRLTFALGPVTLTTAEGKAKGPVPSYTPFSFEEGDVIVTGSSGTIDLSFANGTMVHVAPQSALQLTHLSDTDTDLFLKNGIVLAKVHFDKDRGQRFRITTPSAVATVRGTEFVVEETGSRAHIAVLDEGHVAVTAPGFKKEVMMHFNQETQVARGLVPRDAQVLDRMYHYKTSMAEMRQRIGIVHKHWRTLTEEQRQKIRAAWIKKNPYTPHPRRRRSVVQ